MSIPRELDAADKTVTWSITSGNTLATLWSSGVLTAVDDGEITVRATANDGSGVFGEIKITITNQNITPIEELTDKRFILYPNPVLSELIILNASTIRQVRVFDAQGRTIKLIDNDQSSMSILWNEMPAGFYMLELRDIHHSKFV